MFAQDAGAFYNPTEQGAYAYDAGSYSTGGGGDYVEPQNLAFIPAVHEDQVNFQHDHYGQPPQQHYDEYGAPPPLDYNDPPPQQFGEDPVSSLSF